MVDMAIGIPQPSTRWEGADPLTMQAPTRSSNDEEAGFYWVDPRDPNATDEENPYGSPNLPRKTLPYNSSGNPYPPGTVIQIGGYLDRTGNGQVEFFCAGEAANPVWITAIDINDKPISGMSFMVKGHHVIIEHMDLSKSDPDKASGGIEMRVHNESNLHHCCVRHCYGRGDGMPLPNRASGSVLAMYGGTGNRFHDFVIYNNDLAEYGDHLTNTQNDYHAIHPKNNVDYVWVINNKCHRMGGDGTQLGDAQIPVDAYGTHYYIGNNDFGFNGENPIDVKKCYKVIISGNKLHSANPITGVDNQAVLVVIHDGPEDVWVLNNEVYTGEDAFVTTGSKRVYIMGNKTSNIVRNPNTPPNPDSGWVPGTIVTARGAENLHIVNNTFYGYSRGFNIQSAIGTVIANNIVSNRFEDVEWDLRIISSEDVDVTTLSNNVFYHTDKSFNSRLGGTIYTDVTQIPNQTANDFIDPQLIFTDNFENLSIPATSPCVDAGIDLSWYLTEFNTTFGTNIAADLWYNMLTQGAGKDIGAFETGGAFYPLQPKSPSGLYVDVVNETLRWDMNSNNETSIEVYKEGVEIASLTPGTYSTVIPGIAGSADKYEVGATNAQGTNNSLPITSDIISVTEITGGLVQDLPIDKSHMSIRQYSENVNTIQMKLPVFIGEVYSLPSVYTKFTKEGSEVGSGYLYVTGDVSYSISGTATGTGSVDILLMDNNYDLANVTTSELKVNSSVVKISNSGTFQQRRVNVTFENNLTYSYYPTVDNPKSAIGVSALVET